MKQLISKAAPALVIACGLAGAGLGGCAQLSNTPSSQIEAGYLTACATLDASVQTATALKRAGSLSESKALSIKPFIDQVPAVCPGTGAIPSDPAALEVRAIQLAASISQVTGAQK